MNIYLDVDGVILSKHGLLPSKHLKTFLKYVTDNHDVYWLTSHCKGDSEYTVNYLSRFFNQEIIELLKIIKPTNWQKNKTEAINFKEDFLWLDDYVFDSDLEVLKRNNKLDSWVKIDLEKNPYQLLDVFKPNMVCNAFIIHILFRKYMLHIWTKPKKSVAWHRKLDSQKGKILFIEKYN